VLVGLAVSAAAAIALATSGSSRPAPPAPARRPARSASPRRAAQLHERRAAGPASARSPRVAPVRRRASVRVGVVMLHLVDPARAMTVSGRVVPRSFAVVVRYPIGITRPFALIVFGHGYAVTPNPYAPLLNRWTKAGYVVAAPIFPLENQDAPGGPDEHDLVNQPADMSLVISKLASGKTAVLKRVADLVDLHRIAVAGQSDGGDTALAAAYDPSVRDRRVRAAMILSGAEDPFARAFAMPSSGPPLLAVQGTDDTINPPSLTYAFFDPAARPKYLLKLLGAGHLPPYTQPGAQLTEVVDVTLAFLSRYFKGNGTALRRFARAGSAGPSSAFIADP
jgi:dienelactone hydrolase